MQNGLAQASAAAAHVSPQDEAAEAARQQRILAALDLTPMQVRAQNELLVHLSPCSAPAG